MGDSGNAAVTAGQTAPTPAEEEYLLSDWDPLAFIKKSFLVVVIALTFGLFIPSVVASLDGVFYHNTISTRIPEAARQRLESYQAEQAKLRENIKRIDDQILANSGKPETRETTASLISLRSAYSSELEHASPPIALKPLYLGAIMFLWPGVYVVLGILIVLMNPTKESFTALRTARRVAPLAFGIYVFYEWPLWARNFLVSDEGRVVYAYGNYDVSRIGFVMQEVNIFIFTCLLAVFWDQWIRYYRECQREIRQKVESDSVKAIFGMQTLERLSTRFMQWQLVAFILSVGFVLFTVALWDLVIRNKDLRYLYPAIMAHTLWAVSLALTTLPLIVTWYSWQALKMHAMEQIVLGPPGQVSDINGSLTAIRELQPIGYWNLAASSVVVLASFTLPIIQAFYKPS